MPVSDQERVTTPKERGSVPPAIVAEVYDQLRALAQDWMKRERAGHTLDATALVHEAYLRLADQTRAAWERPEHFFALAATMIRRVLVDHARARLSRKRGGDRGRLTLSGVGEETDAGTGPDLVELDGALDALAGADPRAARVVELRYFAGLGVEDTAAVLGVSARTVKNDWAFARAWLRERLGPGQ
jgi:RNA polymerase sigma factor (TIGR02999 family)